MSSTNSSPNNSPHQTTRCAACRNTLSLYGCSLAPLSAPFTPQNGEKLLSLYSVLEPRPAQSPFCALEQPSSNWTPRTPPRTSSNNWGSSLPRTPPRTPSWSMSANARGSPILAFPSLQHLNTSPRQTDTPGFRGVALGLGIRRTRTSSVSTMYTATPPNSPRF